MLSIKTKTTQQPTFKIKQLQTALKICLLTTLSSLTLLPNISNAADPIKTKVTTAKTNTTTKTASAKTPPAKTVATSVTKVTPNKTSAIKTTATKATTTKTTPSKSSSNTSKVAPTSTTPSTTPSANTTTSPTPNLSTNQTANIVDGVIAVVNNNVILASQLQQASNQMAAQLRAKNQPVPSEQQLYSQALEQMITRQLLLDLVKRQGISPDETELNNALTNIAKQNGVTSLTSLQTRLDSQKAGSYEALRQKISEDLAIQALQQQQVARRVKISDQDIDMFLRSPESNALDEAQYRTIHVRVPFNNTNNAQTVSEKQKQKAMKIAQNIAKDLEADNADINDIIQKSQQDYDNPIEGGDMGYHIAKELPTELSKDITALSVGQVSKPLLTPQGVNVIKLVDKRGGQKQTMQQWNTRHILISPSASLTPEMAKQQIDSLYTQLQHGADFATLASTYSKDPGSAVNGGSLGWVSEGEMVPEFEAMMKNTAVNDFSAPFQSQFGWHILKVDGKRQQDMTDTYRRNMAREALYQRLAPQAFEDWIEELKAQSYIKIMK